MWCALAQQFLEFSRQQHTLPSLPTLVCLSQLGPNQQPVRLGNPERE
jgi:hypothetical protein